jgi:hypothetical protein
MDTLWQRYGYEIMARPQRNRGKQHNKMWGMRRLQRIIEHDPRWDYSHFKVYRSPEEFHGEHALDRPRLLIRTDEGYGRHYNQLRWKDMPREDLEMVEAPPGLEDFKHDINRKRFQDKVAEMDEVGRDSFGDLWDKRREFVVLPTFPRSEIRTFGNIQIQEGHTDKIILNLNRKPTEKGTIRMVKNYKEKHEFRVVKEGDRYKLEGLEELRANVKRHKKSIELAQSVVEFVEKGLNDNQIRMGKPASIAFLSWKKTPSRPEFYDWIDFDHHDLPKKKDT